MVDLLGRPARVVRVPAPAGDGLADRVTSILFGRRVSADPDTELRALASQHPQHAAAIARLAQLLRDQLEDMQRRLGAVWRLSRRR